MAEQHLPAKRFPKALNIFRENHGVLRTSQAIRLGISPATLYALRDAGVIVQENRGVFRLADTHLGDPDLAQVALIIPKAVICLVSALAFYHLTTQIPRRVYIALPRGIQRPRMRYPPLDVIWRSEEAYSAGSKTEYTVDSLPVRIYDREKTLADCLRYEKRVGTDTFLEALKEYLRQRQVNASALMEYARINKVQQRMQAYLEALL
jgi:predicted transcriptional regulator of viral defense system